MQAMVRVRGGPLTATTGAASAAGSTTALGNENLPHNLSCVGSLPNIIGLGRISGDWSQRFEFDIVLGHVHARAIDGQENYLARRENERQVTAAAAAARHCNVCQHARLHRRLGYALRRNHVEQPRARLQNLHSSRRRERVMMREQK